MPVKKKSLVGGRSALDKSDASAEAGTPSTGTNLASGVVSMRKVIAKKIAVEKLLTAKRPG